jgi:hypothetical protein
MKRGSDVKMQFISLYGLMFKRMMGLMLLLNSGFCLKDQATGH